VGGAGPAAGLDEGVDEGERVGVGAGHGPVEDAGEGADGAVQATAAGDPGVRVEQPPGVVGGAEALSNCQQRCRVAAQHRRSLHSNDLSAADEDVDGKPRGIKASRRQDPWIACVALGRRAVDRLAIPRQLPPSRLSAPACPSSVRFRSRQGSCRLPRLPRSGDTGQPAPGDVEGARRICSTACTPHRGNAPACTVPGKGRRAIRRWLCGPSTRVSRWLRYSCWWLAARMAVAADETAAPTPARAATNDDQHTIGTRR